MFGIIAAAGIGRRFGNTKKQFLKIKGEYILELSIKKFLKCGISKIIVTTTKNDIEKAEKILKNYKKNIRFVEGGKTRQESVKNAFLFGLQIYDNEDFVVIHDAARPFFEKEKLLDLIHTVKKSKAAILATKVVDTVKFSTNDEIKKTIDRQNLFLAQTPQAFSVKLYEKALKNAEKKELECTDDSELVEKFNEKITIIKSSKENFKITTKEDLKYAEFLISLEEYIAT